MNEISWRVLFFISGIIILAFGVALTIKTQVIGVGSWDVFHIGLTNTFGLTVGSWSIIVGLTIVAIDCLILKHLPRIGTIMDLLIAGAFIDIFSYILPPVNGLLAQLLVFCGGIFFLAFGSSMYIVANLGVGPRDTLMLLLSKKLGWSVRSARTSMEIIVAILGFALGGPIGIGTVLMAFGLGPIMQWALRVNEKLFFAATGTVSAYQS